MKASYRVTRLLTDMSNYWVIFLIDGKADLSVRGTDGTGMKHYDTQKLAEAAGQRYLKRMKSLGFYI